MIFRRLFATIALSGAVLAGSGADAQVLTGSISGTVRDESGGMLQGATPYQQAYAPMANYGSSNFDVRHMFKGHVAYDVPFGIGRRYASTKGPSSPF